MTPTRLREIAARIERVCSNYQELIGGGYMPCRGCKEAALELRALAAAGLSPGPTPVKRNPSNELDHQPQNPQPEQA